jgi:hypothetical protein
VPDSILASASLNARGNIDTSAVLKDPDFESSLTEFG